MSETKYYVVLNGFNYEGVDTDSLHLFFDEAKCDEYIAKQILERRTKCIQDYGKYIWDDYFAKITVGEDGKYENTTYHNVGKETES